MSTELSPNFIDGLSCSIVFMVPRAIRVLTHAQFHYALLHIVTAARSNNVRLYFITILTVVVVLYYSCLVLQLRDYFAAELGRADKPAYSQSTEFIIVLDILRQFEWERTFFRTTDKKNCQYCSIQTLACGLSVWQLIKNCL